MQTAELILKDCEIPSVPMVAMKILRLVKDMRTDINDLQDAILADQALASRVLRMANSAYYGAGRNIDTVSDAILMMGFMAIKNLALAVSTKDTYKNFGLLEQKMWEHSLGVSVAAGVIAQEIRFSTEEASVAGLLHDVGKVVMNNSQHERFLILTEMVYNDRVTYAQRENQVFGFSHAEVGGLFAQKWEFPPSLCNAIRRHHFENYDDLIDLDPNERTLCCIIAYADAICLRLGVGYRGPMADIELPGMKWGKILGIEEEHLEGLIDTFKKLYIQEKMMYQV